MDNPKSSLRTLQKKHNFVLLTQHEFDRFILKKNIRIPQRHHEHFQKILRRSSPWSALIGDGKGSLIEADAKEGFFSTHEISIIKMNPPAFAVDLVQAWVKPKALAFIVQKAAELGVRSITLFPSALSMREKENTRRLDAIIENACMQSYNLFKPQLSFLEDISQIKGSPHDTFFGDLSANLFFSQIKKNESKSAVFINGPEGGFTDEEIQILRTKATGVLLSENVLRSDSAAIIALGYLKTL
ncbi:MAG: hypothetical protein LDLANPLL_02514 [Turneriella sp.]|nr:hypothetical protein [Turneriella sp.]